MTFTVAPDFADGILTPAKLQQLSDAINQHLPLLARKTADETVNSAGTGSTYQADNQLVVSVDRSAVYVAHLQLIVNSGTTPDFKAQVVLPTGGTANNWLLIQAATGIVDAEMRFITSFTTGFTSATNATNQPHVYSGLITTSSTSGTAQINWAQNTADAGDTTVKTGSFFVLSRVS